MSSIKTSQRQTRSSKEKEFVELPLTTTRKRGSKKDISSSILSSLTISEDVSACASDSYLEDLEDVIIQFKLKKNNDYVFSYGFEWEPAYLHYNSRIDDNDYDRKIIYEYNDAKDENIKTIVTIEKLAENFFNCVSITPCPYNLEIATGVFTYREWKEIEFFKMREHMTAFKQIWDEILQKNIEKKYVIYIQNKTLLNDVKNVNLYNDCGLSLPSNAETLCGYTPDINIKTLATLHGIPQLTTSIPYARVYDFMTSISYYEVDEWVEKPGLFGSVDRERVKVKKNRHGISSLFWFNQYQIKEKMGIECYSFLYVLYNYCFFESLYDRGALGGNYLKSLFVFKPRSNLGVSYQYLREKDPTMENALTSFYGRIHHFLFSKIKDNSLKEELLHDFSLINDEESLMYFRIKFLAYCEDNKMGAYKELNSKNKKLNHEQYCYFFRKYFSSKFPVGSKETLSLQKEYIKKHNVHNINLITDVLNIISISMLYMLRQLVIPQYFRFVTRVDEFNRDKIDSSSPILDGYLYDIPREQLDEYIREGYIKRCTVNIPFCHTHDAPKLTKEGKGLDKKLVADYRLEIFEWVPQNSNFIFEIRDIQTFDKKCKKIDCLDELIEHVLTKVVEFAIL